jgi:hypothetical protein
MPSNRAVLLVFAPLLLAAGVGGFVIPAEASLMSGAPAYNVFHLVAGLVGCTILATGRRRAIAGFNFGFGLIDLWQAVAGVTGLFPAALFALRPADHVVHLLFGTLLVGFGWRGLRGRERRSGHRRGQAVEQR